MNSRLTILAALSLLPVLVARGALETARHDTCGSLVFDVACDLTITANDVSVSRFTYDGHRVTRAETLVGEEVFDVAWLRDAGGLVTNIDYGCGYSVTRTYDDAGRLAAICDSFGHEWTFDFVEDFSAAEAHDGNGALTNILADGASVFNASHDSLGGRRRVT